MNGFDTSRTRLEPTSEIERQLVRSELANVLATQQFSNSKRYPAFLSYVVEKTLDGEADGLKERTIGIEVFHRQPDYDTNSDTIVRSAAGEVRKRLALVYHEAQSRHLVQIVLSAGSYTPEFFQVEKETGVAVASPIDPEKSTPAVQELVRASRSAIARWIAAMLLLAGCLGAIWLLSVKRQQTLAAHSSLERFWQPARSTSESIIICPGAMVFSAASSSKVTKADKNADYPYISLATAGAVNDLVDQFSKRGIRYEMRAPSDMSLTDMREHPIVLVGGYSNGWTMRVNSELRYRFSSEPTLQIYDSANPALIWSRPVAASYSEADDYAIVARLHYKLTDNVVVVLAGIGKNGTQAAAEFVTNERYMAMIDSSQKTEWANKNIEIVLKTKVLDGKTGAPSIEATYSW